MVGGLDAQIRVELQPAVQGCKADAQDHFYTVIQGCRRGQRIDAGDHLPAGIGAVILENGADQRFDCGEVFIDGTACHSRVIAKAINRQRLAPFSLEHVPPGCFQGIDQGH
ncbi:hypothetical protein D3C86_1650140 [compost metagenome]